MTDRTARRPSKAWLDTHGLFGGWAVGSLRTRLKIDKHVDTILSSGLFDLDWYRQRAGISAPDAAAAVRHYLLDRRPDKPDAIRLFDHAWYTAKNPDIASSHLDPLVHYIMHGSGELRDPHPLFNVEYYLRSVGNASTPVTDPLRHFLVDDDNPLRSPHPLFDARFYLDRNPDVTVHIEAPFFHYLDFGGKEVRQAHPLFDRKFYRAHRDAPLPADENALAAYMRGPNTARTTSFFDPDFYLASNPDVAAAGKNPLVHYVMSGSRENRSPHPLFDQPWYVRRYPEALLTEQTALAYFLLQGIAKGHDPNGYFDSRWYRDHHADSLGDAASPIHHFLEQGLARDLQPSRAFDPAFYLEANPDIAESGQPAFLHFMRYGRFEPRQFRNPAVTIQAGLFAIVLHLFYLDLLPEFERLLKPLAGSLDIFVSVPEDKEALFAPIVKVALPSARIVTVANEGRDIGAFFGTLREVDLSPYVAVCKLHSKKGITERDVWRFAMLRSLLGSKQIFETITDRFRFDPDLWLVGPAAFYISARKFIGPNLKGVLGLFSDMYPHAWPDFDWGFFAGSMFWFRPAALERLKDVIDREGAFGSESLVNDGLLSHSVERVFALAAAVEKKRVGLVNLEGEAFSIQTLEIGPANEGISYEEPAETLARFARELGFAIPRSVPSPSRLPAPPSSTPLSKQAGVRLIGPLEFVNGLGISIRAYLRLFEEAGIAVDCLNWTQGFERLSRLDLALPTLADRPPVNIVHMNLDLLLAGRFLTSGPLSEIMSTAHRNVLIFYWELPALKPEWIGLLGHFDEIWCPTTFMQKMVQSVSPVPTRILRPELRLPTEETVTADRPRFDLPEDRFVFAYFADGGSIMARKNPSAFVEAFLAEFREDEKACCYLKIHYAGETTAEIERILDKVSKRKDVVFCDKLYDDATMRSLFQSIDCYVSPHRGEGLGLTIVESLQRGKPVIATPFGGARDFVDDEIAYPLEFELKEVGPGQEPYPADYVWADPSNASLRAEMRRVYSNRGDVAAKGAKAKRRMAAIFEDNVANLQKLFEA